MNESSSQLKEFVCDFANNFPGRKYINGQRVVDESALSTFVALLGNMIIKTVPLQNLVLKLEGIFLSNSMISQLDTIFSQSGQSL